LIITVVHTVSQFADNFCLTDPHLLHPKL
jgi:hypothetical protein